MTFASPDWLAALVAVPVVLAIYLAARRRSARYAIRFTAVPTLRLAAGGAVSSWRTHLPAALALATIAALALALARPHMSYSAPINQASLMLVTDHSGSMAATDVSPTRLDAAVSAANAFIDKLPPSARVGAVAFSDSPDAAQAPTTSHGAARAIIDGQTAGGATDTGDALELALQLLHGSSRKHPPSAIVLLSDGAANTGMDVLTVAREAARDRIPIYTVALGTPGGTLTDPNDPYGPAIPVPPDPQLMQAIAQASGGRTFNAKTADQLSSIYKRLGTRLGSVKRTRDVTAVLAIAGVVLLVGAAGTATRLAPRLP